MQADQSTVMKTVIWTGVVLVIALIIGSIVVVGSVRNKIESFVTDFEVDEQAIADAIVAGISIELPEYDTEKVDELWETLFIGCRFTLKINEGDAETKVYDELRSEWDEAREYVEDNLEDFDDFEDYYFVLPDVFNVEEDFDELEVEVTKLGECEAFNDITYNEDENSEFTVTFEYDFRYQKDDSDKVYKDTLYITGVVEYELDEDGYVFEDVEVTYSL